MNLKQFIEKYQNKSVDFDGAYSAQCVDLFNQYLVDVLKIEKPIQMFPVMSAFQIWDYAKDNNLFKRIVNEPSTFPQEGDIVVWGKGVGKHGHVAIIVSASMMEFTSFDQNWIPNKNINIPSIAKLEKHDYKNVIGFLRLVKKSPDINLDKLVEALNKLDGKKTYITVAGIILTVLGYNLGYIDDKTLDILDTIFLALIGFSLRDAIKKK